MINWAIIVRALLSRQFSVEIRGFLGTTSLRRVLVLLIASLQRGNNKFNRLGISYQRKIYEDLLYDQEHLSRLVETWRRLASGGLLGDPSHQGDRRGRMWRRWWLILSTPRNATTQLTSYDTCSTCNVKGRRRVFAFIIIYTTRYRNGSWEEFSEE